MYIQPSLPYNLDNLAERSPLNARPLPELLTVLLNQDLDFHNEDSGYASHSFHSFPAKFPPQLPRKFILALTHPGDTVLDPMSGSGTTCLEAYLQERRAIGFDIDPLALRLSQIKTTPMDVNQVTQIANSVLRRASTSIEQQQHNLKESLATRWDEKTKEFIDYWFSMDVQMELMALIEAIEAIEEGAIRSFLELIFSAIIITKSGGVSLAFDLAHTRPHRAKIVYDTNKNLIIGQESLNGASHRLRLLTKKLRSPISEFSKRLQQNLRGILPHDSNLFPARIECGNAQSLPLENHSVDLIVTSPPYASNAIDYMRAHKFSLVWLGYSIEELGERRKEYIGGDSLSNVLFESLPEYTTKVVTEIAKLDMKKGQVLHRYYSEMTRTLQEIYRVLKPGKCAIVVVGSSIMRGRDTETAECLADIGRSIGFEVPQIGIRNLDRDRRMLPAGAMGRRTSQIQQRMHEEYVIGFYKPVSKT